MFNYKNCAKMKTISLKELNANGSLMSVFKKNGFKTNVMKEPEYYRKGDPETCYLHYYKKEYVVTRHIIGDSQQIFYNYEDACKRFLENIESMTI